MGRALTLDINTNDAQTRQALARLRRELGQLDGSIEKTSKHGLGLGQVMGGLAVAAGLKYVADQASDLNEATNVTGLIFKDSRGEIDKFVESSAKLGFSEAQARQLTGSIGGLLSNLGLAQDETVEWSKDLLTLGADMGSAFNEDPAEAVGAIGSALRGEMEPIRRFNVVLDDASVRAEAVRMGLAATAAEVDKTGKAQATLSLIMKQTSDVQGDFVNTSDEAANAQRIAKAEFDNSAASLGQSLTPAVAQAAKTVGFLSDGFAGLPPETQTALVVLAGFGVAAKKVEGYVDGLDGGLGDLDSSLSAVDKSLLAASAGLAAFTATTEALEHFSKFKGDAEALNAELALIGDGNGDLDELVDSLGTDLDGLAGKFRQAADAPKDWKDALGELFSKGTEVIDTRQAQNTINELDEALASIASSGNADGAAAAFDEVVAALVAQGLAYDEIIPLLPKYAAAQDRAGRSNKDTEASTDDATSAIERQSKAVEEALDASAKRRGILDDFADAQEASAEAEAELAEARRAAVGDSEEYRDAEQAIADAIAAVPEAQKRATDATNDLNEARRTAAERIRDLAQAERDAAVAADEAALRVEEARNEQRRVNADRTSSDLDKKRAAQDVASAENEAAGARADATQAAADAAEAQRLGIEGDAGVVKAREAVADAERGVADARRAVGDAERDAAKIIEKARADVIAAQAKSAEASLNEAEAWGKVVTQQFGAVAGAQAYRDKLAQIAADLDPSSPLAQRVARLMADIAAAIDASRAKPASSQVGGGQTGTIGDTSHLSRTEAGPSTVINANVTNNITGTPRQTVRQNEASTRKTMDRIARRAR